MQFPRYLFIFSTATILSLVLFHTACAHIHTEMPENVRKMAFLLHEHCVKETGIDEDLSLQMIRGSMPEDRNFGCYLHCMFNTVGLVSPEGHIRFQDIMHLLPARHQEVIADVVERCSTIREFLYWVGGFGRGVTIAIPIFQMVTIPARLLISPSSVT